MIKVITLIKRRPELTREEFLHKWVVEHAPMALSMKGTAVRAYAIAPVVGEHHRADVPDLDLELDGIAEAWFDSRQVFDDFLRTPEAKAWLADGATFIGETKTLVVDYQSVIDPQGMTP
jgi:uncharacterized protein (TIGR02118 family)